MSDSPLSQDPRPKMGEKPSSLLADGVRALAPIPDNLAEAKTAAYFSPAPAAPETSSHGANPSLPILPGYEVLGLLGRGGMDIVYRARQIKANRLDVPPDDSPVDDLARLANMLAGCQLDASGDLNPQPASDLPRLRQDLKAKCPRYFYRKAKALLNEKKQ